MVKQRLLKWGQWVKRHAKVILFGFVCLFLVLTVVTVLVPGKEYSYSPLGSERAQTIGPLVDGKSVTYEFECEEKDITGINVLFSATGGDNTGGLIHAKLMDLSSGQTVHEQAIPTEEIRDNDYYLMQFAKIADSKGKRYAIELTPEQCDSSNAVTLWIGSSNEGDQVLVDGQTESGALVSSLMVEKNKYRLLWELLLLTAASFSLWAVAPEKAPVELSEEKEGEVL